MRALHAAASGATDAALADDRRLTLRSQSMATVTSLVLAVIAYIALLESPPDVCNPSELATDEHIATTTATLTATTTTTITTTASSSLGPDDQGLGGQTQTPGQTPLDADTPRHQLQPGVDAPFMSFNTWFLTQFIVQLVTSLFFGAMTIALSMLLCIKKRGAAPPSPPGRRSSIVRYSEVRASTSPARYSTAHHTGASHRFTAGSQMAGASHLLQASPADHTRGWWTPAGAIGHVDGNPGHQPVRCIHVPKLSNIIFEFADGTTDSSKSLAGIDRTAGFRLAPCEHVVAISGSQTLWLKVATGSRSLQQSNPQMCRAFFCRGRGVSCAISSERAARSPTQSVM